MMGFNHENLQVYQRTLAFNAEVSTWTGQWDNKHAICDQLSRAAGSMLENLAMASAAFSAMKAKSIDYAIGSSLECAACLDLARIKRLLDRDLVDSEKEELSQILRMLVGLRKSFTKTLAGVQENCEEYAIELVSEKAFFHHEALDVYRVALEAAGLFCSSDPVSRLSNRVFRRLDELLTSMVLNIAEGNGRFSDADQARFLGTSHESAIKLAARLDLCVIQSLLPLSEVNQLKQLLERVSVMTASLMKCVQA